MTKKEQKAREVEARRQAAYVKKVRGLLAHISERISDATILTNYHGGMIPDDFAAQRAALEPVGKAIHGQKAEAMDHAEQAARAVVEKVEADLKAHGFDRKAAAPFPRSSHGRAEYAKGRAKYGLYHELTCHEKTEEYVYRGNDAPDIVIMSEKGIARYVDNARRDAATLYDAFICKMVGKVGEVVDARITGSHIWGHSFLTVTKGDGATEVWKTQQIVNHSVLGNWFYQWPSRKMKS